MGSDHSRRYRFYIDTNVLVNYVYMGDSPDQNELADLFMKKIRAARFDGVVSLLALVELVKVMRRLLLAGNKPFRAILRQGLKSHTDIIKDIIKQLYDEPNLIFVEGTPPNPVSIPGYVELTYSAASYKSLELMLRYPGKLNSYGPKGPDHKGIFPIDAYHIVLAKCSNCHALATFDTDFEETGGEIRALILQRRMDDWWKEL